LKLKKEKVFKKDIDLNERSFIIVFMRLKDESKYEAIMNASVKIINSEGLAKLSMSKIAKAAKVSAATIYVYFENKDALLKEVYFRDKQKFSDAIMDDFNHNVPVKEGLYDFFVKTFFYLKENQESLMLIDQFENSPIIKDISPEEPREYFDKVITLYERGIKDGILIDGHDEICAAYFFFPILRLVRSELNGLIVMDEENLKKAFEMSWNAIKVW